MSDWFAPSYWYGAGPDFSSVNNAVANNQANIIPNMNANMAYVNAQYQNALAAAAPTPYGYGFVGGYPSFGPAAAPGTYSAGSGRSSFSGVALPGGGGSYDDAAGLTPSTAPNGLRNPFAPGSGSAQRWAAQFGGGIGSDAARAPNQPPILPQYQGPASYGWTHNEGAPVPQQTYQPPMGEFRPHTYGWDANEGASLRNPFSPGSGSFDRWNAMYNSGSLGTMNPTTGGYQPAQPPQPPQPSFQQLWQDRGRVYQPPHVPSPYGPGGYPAMTPRGGEGQSGLENSFGMNLANGPYGDPFGIIPGG